MRVHDHLKDDYAAYMKKNQEDGYSAATVGFGEKWAELMEARMDAGAKLEDIAKECEREADEKFGITGAMYGFAVHGLSHFWIHGEALRVWHNGNYGVKSESGTVNPAILTIG